MKVEECGVPGVLRFTPRAFADERGYFTETWRAAAYRAAGIAPDFVQDNLSFSEAGVLRGLHLQEPHAQGKLVYVLRGAVFDVAVDLRRDSPHFGAWTANTLSSENRAQLWVPPGFAHGFCVTSAEGALFAYKCTAEYHAASELSVRWNDPELAIPWPDSAPRLSPKDAAAPLLRDIPRERLPR